MKVNVEERVRQLEEEMLNELGGKRSVVVHREEGVHIFFVSFPSHCSWRRVRSEMLQLKSRFYRKYKDILEHVAIQPIKEDRAWRRRG